MKLKTQKKVAKISGVALAGAGLIWGASALFTGGSDEPAEPAPEPRVAETVPAPAPKQAVPATKQAPAVITGDSAETKDAKLKKLTVAHTAELGERGYTIRQPLGKQGRTCNPDGTTDGDGWNGYATSFSYSVQENETGKVGRICVDHSGKEGSKIAVTAFNPAADSPAVQIPESGNKAETLRALQMRDVGDLRAIGYAVKSVAGEFGRRCDADGTTDGLGYKGKATAISYNVAKDGSTGLVCVERQGEGSKQHVVGGFVPYAR